jgi:anti-sigma regulatory factor (Ser/Thr protein kinase)
LKTFWCIASIFVSVPFAASLSLHGGVHTVISLALRPRQQRWQTLSFPSTLYLCPVLDLLLKDIPNALHAELRLGLQEALVNAAKHGNRLDLSKSVHVKFSHHSKEYAWIIVDEGEGFTPPNICDCPPVLEEVPEDAPECGRGLFILYQVFDEVVWQSNGTELRLVKKCA